jgi:hypothetical protein
LLSELLLMTFDGGVPVLVGSQVNLDQTIRRASRLDGAEPGKNGLRIENCKLEIVNFKKGEVPAPGTGVFR